MHSSMKQWKCIFLSLPADTLPERRLPRASAPRPKLKPAIPHQREHKIFPQRDKTTHTHTHTGVRPADNSQHPSHPHCQARTAQSQPPAPRAAPTPGASVAVSAPASDGRGSPVLSPPPARPDRAELRSGPAVPGAAVSGRDGRSGAAAAHGQCPHQGGDRQPSRAALTLRSPLREIQSKRRGEEGFLGRSEREERLCLPAKRWTCSDLQNSGDTAFDSSAPSFHA